MTIQVLIPDIGEAKDVEVIEILVSQGETVEADASLIVLESDKASMEIDAPFSGKLVEILVQEGDSPEIGEPIARVEVSS